MKVYVSKQRMNDTDHGWILSSHPDVQIKMNDALFQSLSEGWYEENFAVQLSTCNAKMLRKLKRLASLGEDVYFGFWLEEGNRLFQVQMMLKKGSKKKQEIPATLTFIINGLPEIFPIPFTWEEQEGLCS